MKTISEPLPVRPHPSILQYAETHEELEKISQEPLENFLVLVGNLHCISKLRTGIQYATVQMAMAHNKPTMEHWYMCQYILGYLKGTISYGPV